MNDDGTVPVEARLRSSRFSIGALGRVTGLRPSAIRYYEAAGLLPAPARRYGQRVYDHTDFDRLRAINAARGLGFSIREIKALSSADMETRRAAGRAKASFLREAITELETNATRLEQLSNCDCALENACRLATRDA